jgi:hypothetical protein
MFTNRTRCSVLVGLQFILGTCAAREKEAIRTWESSDKRNERGKA